MYRLQGLSGPRSDAEEHGFPYARRPEVSGGVGIGHRLSLVVCTAHLAAEVYTPRPLQRIMRPLLSLDTVSTLSVALSLSHARRANLAHDRNVDAIMKQFSHAMPNLQRCTHHVPTSTGPLGPRKVKLDACVFEHEGSTLQIHFSAEHAHSTRSDGSKYLGKSSRSWVWAVASSNHGIASHPSCLSLGPRRLSWA